MKPLPVRPGRESDLPTLVAIYNHYIEHTPITFDLAPVTVEQRRPWFAQFHVSGRRQLFVATVNDEAVGYACSVGLRPKAAYDPSVEVSVYIAPARVGQGIGAALYEALFAALAKEDVHRAYAGITLPNPASEKLHARFGFEPVGTWNEVGRKFDRYWDVAWMEKRFG